MKFLKSACLFFTVILASVNLMSQVPADTINARKYFNSAIQLEGLGKNDSAIIYAEKAHKIYSYLPGEKSIENANSLHLLGRLYYNLNEFEKALEYNYRALAIRKELLGNDHPDLARTYFNIGLIRFYSGEIEKALPEYRESLRIRLKSLPGNHPDLARSYYNLGQTCFELGEYDNALEYYKSTLKVARLAYGEKSEDAALSLHQIGVVNFKKGLYDPAVQNFLEALSIRKELYPGNNPDLASTYNMLGNAYCFSGKYDSAMENFLISLKMRQELFGENSSDVASSYLNIGNVYFYRGDYKVVPDYYSKATAIYISLYGEDHPLVASSLNNTGVICQYSGDYDKAIENHLRSLRIRKKLYGEKHPDLAENYVNTASCYRAKGELDKSLDLYLKVPEIFGESGNEPPVLATAYAGIGGVYSEKDEYNRGLEYLLKAADIRKRLLGESHIDVAETMTSIGAAYYNLHEYDQALTYYQNSVNILTHIFGPKHPSLAEVYSNIGILYDQTGNHDEALNYHFKALDINREMLGERHPSTGRAYNNAGNAYAGKGDNDNALEYYSKALANNRAIYGEKHALVAQIYWNIGSVYERKGDFDCALRYYQKAAGASSSGIADSTEIRSVPASQNPVSWKYLIEALNKKAILFAALNHPVSGLSAEQRMKSALMHYQVCDTLIDITRKKISSLNDKLSLGEISNQICRQAVDILTTMKAGSKKIPAKDGKMAFYFSEKNKSAVLLEALAGQEAQHFAGIPDSLLEKEHRLKSDIAFYAGRISESIIADSTEIEKYKDVVFKRNISLDSLIKVFEVKYPDYHNLKYNTYCREVRDIQKILDSKTAILSYFLGDSTITIFTVTRSKFNVTKVPHIENIADSIGWFRYGLINTSPRMQKAYSRLGYKLYRELFPEDLLKIQDIENLVIIPDGELSIIPFEALLTDDPKDYFGEYGKYPYLVKKYNISYSYSANLFYLTSNSKSHKSVGVTDLSDWLALAPVFDDKEVKMTKLSTDELNRHGWLRTDSSMVRRTVFGRQYVAPLPATKTEAENISAIFSQNNLSSKVLLYDDASENFIKSPEISKFRFLHFATHGFINAEQPEFSGLLLSGDTTGGEDGILYAGEMYNLRLNADLIVLSACETGLGKIQRGEGIIGLTRALLYAGGNNIIVSLWQVADESTADLMVDFYRNLLELKQSYSAALRNARLKMINGNKYAHPQYWSPFILIGK